MPNSNRWWRSNSLKWLTNLSRKKKNHLLLFSQLGSQGHLWGKIQWFRLMLWLRLQGTLWYLLWLWTIKILFRGHQIKSSKWGTVKTISHSLGPIKLLNSSSSKLKCKVTTPIQMVADKIWTTACRLKALSNRQCKYPWIMLPVTRRSSREESSRENKSYWDNSRCTFVNKNSNRGKDRAQTPSILRDLEEWPNRIW